MGMMKNYLLKLLEQCSEEQFGQDAIEWAIFSRLVPLTYDLDRDSREIMSRYDEIIEAYRRSPALTEGGQRKPHEPARTPASRQRSGTMSQASATKRSSVA